MFDDVNKNNQGAPTDDPLTNQEAMSQGGAPLGQAAPVSSAGQPQPPEDIFSHEDGGAAGGPPANPPVFQPKPPLPPDRQPASQLAYAVETTAPSGAGKKIFVLIGILIGLGALGAGGYYGYHKFMAGRIGADNIPVETKDQDDQPPLPDEIDNQPVAEEEEPLEDMFKDLPATTPELPGSTGQAGSGQAEQPTTTANADADQDGLLDSEEQSFGTNPNNVDSDADGLFDREEIKVYKTDPNSQDSDGDGYTDGAEVESGYNPLGAGKLYRAE